MLRSTFFTSTPRAGMMSPVLVKMRLASGPARKERSFQAASGFLEPAAITQPEPSMSTMLPALPRGKGTTSKSNLARALRVGTRQRPSTIIPVCPFRNMVKAPRSWASSGVGATWCL